MFDILGLLEQFRDGFPIGCFHLVFDALRRIRMFRSYGVMFILQPKYSQA